MTGRTTNDYIYILTQFKLLENTTIYLIGLLVPLTIKNSCYKEHPYTNCLAYSFPKGIE